MTDPSTGDDPLVVEEDHDGLRLDQFLATILPAQSRSQIQRLIKEGHVAAASGAKVRASTQVRAGERYVVDVPELRPATPQPEALPLRIVFEDSDVVVLDKPAGMVVHPGAGHAGGTLVNALLHHVKDLSGVGGEARPGIVHRLDRGTSGLMVVAKHDRAHQELTRQFQHREVEKEYIALVWGVVQAGRRIDEPIGRDPKDRQKMSTRARRARSAVTRVTFARHFTGVSFIRVAIATGRTHQIRVHLSAIGHPIVGDQTYGGVHRRVANNLRAVQRLERPFLHAGRLAFTHPGDGRRVEFDSPLPPELEAVVEEIAAKEEES
jgi:23S rRNA pseudouridine1911/1915/1917 synthase